MSITVGISMAEPLFNRLERYAKMDSSSLVFKRSPYYCKLLTLGIICVDNKHDDKVLIQKLNEFFKTI